MNTIFIMGFELISPHLSQAGTRFQAGIPPQNNRQSDSQLGGTK